MSNIISIDRYEATVNKQGIVEYYAIKGKQHYKMPECHKTMYTDDYLAIREIPNDEFNAQLYGIAEEKFYIPIRTV